MTAAEKKLAHKRLSALELAQKLGNVSEACRRRGLSRTQFYEYKRRFQTHGFEGLVDLPPIHHSHPQTTPPEVVDKMLEVSLRNPMWGCHRLSAQLKLEGISLSGITIQKLLDQRDLGSKYQRLLRLEELAHNQEVELTAAQVAAIEKANPCYKERHVESSRPGELLSQDTYYVGHFKGVGKVYLQSVVDTFGSYAFGYLHCGKQAEHSVAVLYNDVLPRYAEWGLELGAVLTDNGREYCGTEDHPYELFLELSDIEHRRTKVRSPQTNGFVERFHRTVLDEFFRPALRGKFYESVESLQQDLDSWLVHYNTERPHLGYRNMGKRPIDTVNEYLETVTVEG